MTLRSVILVPILLAVAYLAADRSSTAPGNTRYHVDYEHGSDQNSGLTPEASWKHAPGDAAAEGQPRATRLRPGDRVTFAAGAIYRGMVVASDSGTRAAPIIYEGADGDAATISGSQPVEALPCTDQPACAGMAGKAVLLRIDRQAALSGTIFDSQGPMRLAQDPEPLEALYPDEITQFHSIATSRIAAGQLRLPVPVADCASDCGMEIALWVQSNVVVPRPVLAIRNSIASFDPQGLKFYTDRDTRYALRGLRQFLDQPGEYLPIADGLVLAIPRGAGGCCSLATGNGGFLVRNASWITIRNLGFEQMGDNGTFGKGIAIFANTPGIAGLTISDNRFRSFDLRSGTGVINLRGVSDLAITGNRIDTVVRGSGIRLAGPSERTRIAANRIERIGRTAIYVSNTSDVEVAENFIADIKGVHGNGLTAYLSNQRVTFRRNTVIDAKQPATFHGSNSPDAPPHFITFTENLLISTPDALGALISWGQFTREVSIRDNILLGGRFGLRMNKTDQNLVAMRNIGMPPAPTAPNAEPGGSQANRWLQSRPRWEAELLRYSRSRTPPSAEQKRRICRAMFGSASSGRAVGADFVCP